MDAAYLSTFVSYASGAWYLPDLDFDLEDEGPNTPLFKATSGGKLPDGHAFLGASLQSRPSVEALHERGIMQVLPYT